MFSSAVFSALCSHRLRVEFLRRYYNELETNPSLIGVETEGKLKIYARCLQNQLSTAQKNTKNINVSNTVRGKNTSTTFLIRHTDFQKQKKTMNAK